MGESLESTNGKGRAEVRRFMLREKSALLAIADFEELFEELRKHTRRWEVPIDDLSYVMLRQAIGGAALYASGRPPDESAAFTFNIAEPAVNVFSTVNGPRSEVIGRAFLEDVQTEEESRLFVETTRRGSDPTRSALSVDGLDLLVILEQYFERSVQLPTRFFELEGEEMLMMQGLPKVDADWIAGLDRDSAAAWVDRAQEPVESRIFHLACGCTAERLAQALLRTWGENPDDLFQEQAGVEVVCPRCGSQWWIDRESFQRQWLKGGLSGQSPQE